MKLFAPAYYKKFTCIADKCSHSCCVGWEIDVDKHTLEKYKTLTHAYGEAIRNSIDYSEAPHFRLCGGERCPHLDEKGLCRIITELGEGYLCEICTEHPRFYNDTMLGKEVGIGMACEESCRIILESDGYAQIEEIGELRGEAEDIDLDILPYREKMYEILSDPLPSYEKKLQKIYSHFGVSPNQLTDREWRDIIAQLEYLDEDHREMLLCYSSDTSTPKELEKALERALAYFIYRHIPQSFDEEDLACRLGLCLFCERLLCSLAKKNPKEIALFARIISEEIEYSVDNTEQILSAFDTEWQI